MTGALAALRAAMTPDERAAYADLFAHGDVLAAARPLDPTGRYRDAAIEGALATLAVHQIVARRQAAEMAAALKQLEEATRAVRALVQEWR